MTRSFGANRGKSPEKCGESQVVIRASAVVSLRFSPDVRVRAPARPQGNRLDNRLCCWGRKKDANKSSPAQTSSCRRGMPHSLTSFCDCFRLAPINFSFLPEHSIRTGAERRDEHRKLGGLCSHCLIRSADGTGGDLCSALQSRGSGILPRRKPRSMVGSWPELLHVWLQCVDVYGCCRGCLPRGNSGHRSIYWQRAEFSAGVFRLRQTLAAESDYHSDGIFVRPLQPGHSPDFLLDYDCVSAFYQRQYVVWAEPVRVFGVWISRSLDDRGGRCAHCLLLCFGWPLGSGSQRFSAGVDSNAVLPGARHPLARARGRSDWPDPFSAPGDEDAARFRRIWMDLSRVLDHHGFLWIQHQRNGATLLQRRQRAFGPQSGFAVLRTIFRGRVPVVYSAHGHARGLSRPAHRLAFAGECQRGCICGCQPNLAAPWSDWRDAGGDVQRHHGQLVRAVQSQVGDSIQRLVSSIAAKKRRRP